MKTKTEKSQVAPPETCGKCGKVIAGAEAAFMLDGQIACGACVTAASKITQKAAWMAEVNPPAYWWMKFYGGILSTGGGTVAFASLFGIVISFFMNSWIDSACIFAGSICFLLIGIALAAAGELMKAIRDGVRNTFYIWPH